MASSQSLAGYNADMPSVSSPLKITFTRHYIFLVVIFLLASCSSPTPATGTIATPASTSTPAPARDFTLQSLAGENVTLSDFQGQWVLVNFWATWCPPCVSEMPYLQKVADQREMVVLGVNFKESQTIVERFIDKWGITYPILINPDDDLLMFYQAQNLPRTHVIAPDGTIVLKIIGPLEEERFDSWLDRVGVGYQKEKE